MFFTPKNTNRLQPSNRINLILFFLLILLIGYGLNILLSSSYFLAEQKFQDPYFYFKKQAVFAGLGLIALFVTSMIPYKFWQRLSWPLYIFSIFLLLLVFLPVIGKKAGGAFRWIQLAGFSLQPSDIVKFTIILVIARIYSIKENLSWSKILITLSIILLPSGLILIEPDLGTTLQLLLSAGLLLMLTGFPVGILALLSVASVPTVYFTIYNSPYRWERIKSFLDPIKYRYEGGYQLYASFKSFLGGGMWGKGLGESLKRHNLQARHTDFIAAVIAEDLGFIGIAATFILFFAIFLYSLYLMSMVEDTFGKLLGSGILFIFITQAMLNMAVTMGLVPTTGINLPIISYGGTSIVTFLSMFGIVLNITRESFVRGQ